jgi:FAD/FMN-containing dehydrogenase
MVGKQNLGSAVTVGSGVHLSDIYQAAKANGKIVVGGSAATECAGGGYLQGGGHSALGPTLGMASDNALGLSPSSAAITETQVFIQPHRIPGRRCKWRTPHGQ